MSATRSAFNIDVAGREGTMPTESMILYDYPQMWCVCTCVCVCMYVCVCVCVCARARVCVCHNAFVSARVRICECSRPYHLHLQ